MPTDHIRTHLLRQGDRLGYSSPGNVDETLVVIEADAVDAVCVSDADRCLYRVHRDGDVEPLDPRGSEHQPTPDRVTFGSHRPYGPELVFGEVTDA